MTWSGRQLSQISKTHSVHDIGPAITSTNGQVFVTFAVPYSRAGAVWESESNSGSIDGLRRYLGSTVIAGDLKQNRDYGDFGPQIIAR